jgi:hypothetical protein
MECRQANSTISRRPSRRPRGYIIAPHERHAQNRRHAHPQRARPAVVSTEPDKMLCERCGAEMFRMHAVWRCPECRFKTDCCGW